MFWQEDRDSFEELLYGSASYHNLSLIRHVGFGDLTIALLGVLGALLFIAVNENLDTVVPPNRATIGESFSGTREPGFLDAEILPPEGNDSNRRPSNGDEDDYRRSDSE